METDAGVNALRDSIRQSPDPWKVLKKLKPETRAKLIDFVDSGDHLTEDTWDAAEDETAGHALGLATPRLDEGPLEPAEQTPPKQLRSRC